jgi:hypothetical protein
MAGGGDLKPRLGSDSGKITKHSVATRPIRARFDQMTVWRHVVQSPVLIKQRLMTCRTVTIVGGFDLNRRGSKTRIDGQHRADHWLNIPPNPRVFYSFFPLEANFYFW